MAHVSILALILSAPLAAQEAGEGVGALSIHNHRLACAGSPLISGPFVGFLVDEEAQAGADLNADGDADDLVLHVLDTRTGEIVDAGLGTRVPTLLAADGVFVIQVTEASDGAQDKNGDGDTGDTVPVLFDAASRVTTNTGVAQSNRALLIDAGRLYIHVRESNQGGLDRNQDGDASDDVIAWVDLATGRTVNTGLASARDVVPFERWLGVQVGEAAQGQTDLNGDGAVDDEVMHVIELHTGAVSNLGMDTSGSLAVGGGRLVVAASEFGDGVDYDGDGQISFLGILHVYDARAGTTSNIARPAAFFVASPEIEGLMFFGDNAVGFPPYPVHAFDVASERIWPLGVDTRQPLISWQTFVATPAQQSEPTQVADALSGEARTLSTFFYFANIDGGLLTGYQGNPTGPLTAYDPLLRQERLLGPTTGSGGTYRFDRSGAVISWIQHEVYLGTDFNGDGDTIDAMLRVYDPAEDRVHAIDIAARGFNPREHALANEHLAFLADEPSGGATDLNGDGDADDSVLHVARLSFPSQEEVRYGQGVRGWRAREPHLDVLGVAAAGRVLAAQLRRARPAAVGALVVGIAPDAVPLFGGTLLVRAPFLGALPLASVGLGFDGVARVELGLLPPELAGESLYLQAGVVDAAASGGVALSRGLRLTVGG